MNTRGLLPPHTSRMTLVHTIDRALVRRLHVVKPIVTTSTRTEMNVVMNTVATLVNMVAIAPCLLVLAEATSLPVATIAVTGEVVAVVMKTPKLFRLSLV